MVDVLVDGCQCRMTNAAIRGHLSRDFLLAITGSKFVAGPAFCGALLVPPALARLLRRRTLPPELGMYSACADWPADWAAQSSLQQDANWGLLLRLEASLAHWREFRALPPRGISAFVEEFAAAIRGRMANDPILQPLAARGLNRRPISDNRDWDAHATIFPFLVRHVSGCVFDDEETTRLYEMMKMDLSGTPRIPAEQRALAALRCLLGQPIAVAARDGKPISALRLNLDMRLILDAVSSAGRGFQAVISDALSTLDKTALLARYLFGGC
jgi:hypothetical protein